MPSKKNLRILVIGDVMLDQYVHGDTHRISPEAPVPVVHIRKETINPGGAGNVAVNLHSLGIPCVLAGIRGSDREGTLLVEHLSALGIEHHLEPISDVTITKTRVLSKGQQLLRLDKEETFRWNDQARMAFVNHIKSLSHIGMVIISDYGKGLIDSLLSMRIIAHFREKNIPVIVDPKQADWAVYKGAYLITPNFKEYQQAGLLHISNTDEAMEKSAADFRFKDYADYILVTRSEKGMTLFGADLLIHQHTLAREVFDVSGAGDTVVAVIAAALLRGIALPQAIQLANKAAGIVVAKSGTVPILAEELAELNGEAN